MGKKNPKSLMLLFFLAAVAPGAVTMQPISCCILFDDLADQIEVFQRTPFNRGLLENEKKAGLCGFYNGVPVILLDNGK